MVAIAASVALHCGIFVSQPLFSRFGSPPGQTQSGGSVQRTVVRVIEQTPGSVGDLPMTATTLATPEVPKPVKIEAGGVGDATATMQLNPWRLDADTKFYTIAEVDQPALPVLTWQLSPQILAALQLRHLVVQVWIAENGDILNVALLFSQPEISEEQKQNIEQSLVQTQMTPATKNGRQVASQRTLEMALEF